MRRTLGVGSRISMLVLSAAATLAGASACSTDAVDTESGDPSRAVITRSERASEPEQVVQNIVGTGPNATNRAATGPSERTAEGGGAVRGEARASAAGMSRASGGSLPSRSNAAETITSKHLEAELNRLEAELAN